MKTLATLSAGAAAVLLSACSSPPVRVSPGYGPGDPVPTLAAASVYDYYIEEETVNLDGVIGNISARDAAKAIGRAAAENPDAVLRGIGALRDRYTAVKMVEEVAPTLDQKIAPFLKAQGFILEVDGSRTAKLEGGGMGAGDYTYVAPDTAAYPFTDQLPLFGPGSKGNIAERLSSGRDREAFASVFASFVCPDDDVDAVQCNLTIMILDNEGDVVFEAKTTGQGDGAPGRNAKQVLEMAFDAALAQMNNPVVEEA